MTTSIFGSAALGKEDFLLLLVTQLKNQDPLSPMDAQDFASQLAQFSALEQQVQTNDLLGQQMQMRTADMLEAQNSVAIGMIGKGVVIEGDQVDLTGSETDGVWVATSGTAQLTVRLTDEGGRVVREVEAAVSGGGLHRIELGEAATDLPPGSYTVSVAVENAAEGVVANPAGSGVVSGVRWGDTGPVLVVGNREVPLSAVLQITN